MSTTLQPPPVSQQIIGNDGKLTLSWVSWFRDLFSRVGQAVQLSNTELSNAQSTLSTSVAGLTGTVSGHSTDISSINSDLLTLQTEIDGLAQGRNL